MKLFKTNNKEPVHDKTERMQICFFEWTGFNSRPYNKIIYICLLDSYSITDA